MIDETKLKNFLDAVKWDASGLAPCVVQDARDLRVLMVAYMNRASLERTFREGRACYWSRSRGKFWLKGEESGNFQEVRSIQLDCDGDCLLLFAGQKGGAACHTGMRSCFYRTLQEDGTLAVTEERVFDPGKVYGKS
ncbi:MAG: phosphoribosyl-AMP cyclohydrolase [Elusimicrobia bacterium RIFCSPLOWO2_01_FULL_64_13]|nr:MAG: phosphoribosyl-AMP cyclohydrolase [Elusimicrobia bacterium RIFCSPHIGHO2_01_FULL_64_10]OGR96465.1 MAG: phosphoribosyl-AMP cyclohydrolase [Elusimicrobia bacterium RIFCSPLOWO2_01_FULL_64_13]